MKKSQRKNRRDSIWTNRPEHQDLQESRSGRMWAGRLASCSSKKAWKNVAVDNLVAV